MPKMISNMEQRTRGAFSTAKTSPVILIILFVIINLTNSNLVAALKCYKCTMTKPSPHTNETVRLCAHFDYTAHYVVECPYSTMCMKKDISVNLPTPINGTERDCALQRYDYQDLEDGRWQLKVAIEEPYKEGCSVIDDKGLRSSRTEYCYCRGDMCNSSITNHQITTNRFSLIVFNVLIAFTLRLNLCL